MGEWRNGCEVGKQSRDRAVEPCGLVSKYSDVGGQIPLIRDFPDALVEDVRQGRVVLLLGAGAARGAKNQAGQEPPTGEDLRDLLSDGFLGGRFRDQSLAWVADLAISETDLVRVQDFIADLLRDLRPAPFHHALPTFRWRGLVTTNYDLVTEGAYASDRSIQKLVPCISDRDRLDEKLRAPDSLALLKLHGCITRTHEPDLPLILTTDQYVTHRAGRGYLFKTFENWGIEYPVVFIGHGGQDPDLRALLLEVSKEQSRPRWYAVKPGTTEIEGRFWESKRVTVLDGTFEDFLDTLDSRIPSAIRPLLRAVKVDQPIKRRFAVNEEVNGFLLGFLSNDVEYVHESLPIDPGSAAAFYKGFDLGWYPIGNRLDVPRHLTDTLLNDVVIQAEEERPATTELHVVKAEAGAGKSVFLRRLAWEAATQADALSLYLRENGELRYEGLREVHRVTRQRLFLFVDGAAEHAASLAQVLGSARRERLPLTVFTAERSNVWNMACERLVPLLTEAHELRYLSHTEIQSLVELLTLHGSLGPSLTGKTAAECVRQFEERAGRQLLVALHEATMGVPFEEILLNEYEQIEPNAARQLYLTVCVLNRLNVAVRAGLIARVHGIRFAEFKERFFTPLEHVVQVRHNLATQDYLYTARHEEIAQIVFDRVLRTPEDRYNEYVRIIRELNLAYGTDRTAFRGLLRAKSLHELFPEYQNVRALFDVAETVGPKEAFVYQQEANYERVRPNGNLSQAEKLLERARELDPRDTTLLHTLAELKRSRAEAATHTLERQRLRNEARALLRPLVSDTQTGGYARHTLVKLAIDDLEDTLRAADATDRQIDTAIRAVEDPLQRGLQQYPGDLFLLTAEADFSRLLNDHQRSFEALSKAFEANRRDPYIASRLARLLEERGDLEAAKQTLHDALQANRGDQRLNYQYATALRKGGVLDREVLLYHYRRAFSKWDSNFEAQFWFARFAFESSDRAERAESKDVFRHLREAPLAHDIRVQVQDMIGEPDHPQTVFGEISRLEYVHGFVAMDGTGDWIFLHKNHVAPDRWDQLRLGQRVSFNVGFSFSGPIALEPRPI